MNICSNIASIEVNLHDLECPGSSLRSQKRILGLVDSTVDPRSPLLGANDVSTETDGRDIM